WIVDFVAIKMEDRQHRAVPGWVQELIDVPGSRQRSSFGFTIANHCCHDQVGVVERSATGMGQDVAELPAFMDRTRRFRRAVTSDPARKRKLLEEFTQSLRVRALFRIYLRVRAFQISRTENSGGAMSRAGQENHVKVVFLNQPVQMNINE